MREGRHADRVAGVNARLRRRPQVGEVVENCTITINHQPDGSVDIDGPPPPTAPGPQGLISAVKVRV